MTLEKVIAMFGLFRPPKFGDPQLGELERRRGLWRGTLTLEGRSVPLALSGPRSGPDPEAINLARRAASDFAACRREMEAALFEHYSPYAESVAAGEEHPDGRLLAIDSPAAVWPEVTIEFVRVTPLDREFTTEIGCGVTWDEEHTLALQLREGKLLGLCGSVLAP